MSVFRVVFVCLLDICPNRIYFKQMNNKTEKRLVGIRGATGAENTAESIIASTVEMCEKIITENCLEACDIVSVVFSMTRDLTMFNPATAFRKHSKIIDTSHLALFCCQEVYVEGAPEKMIRVLVTSYMACDKKPVNIFVGGAEKIRPDFAGK